jgi:hypothetical protein
LRRQLHGWGSRALLVGGATAVPASLAPQPPRVPPPPPPPLYSDGRCLLPDAYYSSGVTRAYFTRRSRAVKEAEAKLRCRIGGSARRAWGLARFATYAQDLGAAQSTLQAYYCAPSRLGAQQWGRDKKKAMFASLLQELAPNEQVWDDGVLARRTQCNVCGCVWVRVWRTRTRGAAWGLLWALTSVNAGWRRSRLPPPPAPQDIACIGAGFRGQRAKKGFGDSKPPVMQASQLRTCGWLGQGGWGTPQDRPVLFRDTLLVCLTLPHEPRAFWITWSRSGELFTS